MSADSERVYTIPLGKVLLSPDNRRAMRAINMIREFARHHMKVEDIRIEEKLSHEIWARGIKKPPRKVRVRMSKTDEGHILVSPYTLGEPDKAEDAKDAGAEKGAEAPEEIKDDVPDAAEAETAAPEPETVKADAPPAPEPEAAKADVPDAGKDSKAETPKPKAKADVPDAGKDSKAKADTPKPKKAKADAPSGKPGAKASGTDKSNSKN